MVFLWEGLDKQRGCNLLITDHFSVCSCSNGIDVYTGKAKFIGELLVPVAPFDQKSGREAWTVAFAPNGSYFAWSQGHRIVRLIPWTKCLKNL